MITRMEMQSKFQGKPCNWGEPIITKGDMVLTPPSGFTCLKVEENEIKDGGVLIYKGNNECEVTFDWELSKATIRHFGKLFTIRLPRKKKKALKKAFEREYGLKITRFHFNKSLKRRKRYERNKR